MSATHTEIIAAHTGHAPGCRCYDCHDCAEWLAWSSAPGNLYE